MTTARYLVADVFDGLASLEDSSVDLVLSSPPFLALRSYLPADHPDKHREIGSEATPADFLDTLLDVVEACDRVLAPHGSLVFELGDTYSGSGGAGGDYNDGGLREGQQKFRQMNPRQAWRLNDDGTVKHGTAQRITEAHNQPAVVAATGGAGWPLDKSLCGIPTLFAWSLAYGRNLLRPERETPRWRIRNLIVWCRPNPPVGALGDKVRPATSYLTVATKARDRYFDLDAVRHVGVEPGAVKHETKNHSAANPRSGWEADRDEIIQNPAGAPPLDYWVIPTQPFSGSHYATWPERLCEVPVKAMCPLRVCRQCGQPSRRIVSDPEYDRTDSDRVPPRLTMLDGQRPGAGVNQHLRDDGANTSVVRRVETVGWTDCGHDDWRTGLVLDPFAGSGTTLQVATGHGRDAIGIDLDERNAELARERVGPLLLTVEHLAREFAVTPGSPPAPTA